MLRGRGGGLKINWRVQGMKGQRERQPEIAKGNLLTRQTTLTYSINSLPRCAQEEAAGGNRWRFPGKREWSEGCLRGERRGPWWGTRLCLLGSITGLRSVPGSSTPAAISWERSGGRRLPDVPLLHGARRDVQCNPPPALSIPGNLPCAGKTILTSWRQSTSVVK